MLESGRREKTGTELKAKNVVTFGSWNEFRKHAKKSENLKIYFACRTTFAFSYTLLLDIDYRFQVLKDQKSNFHSNISNTI